ncbi:MAG TPA: hypothetical protein DDW81_04220, partial [Cryomorphaceae bacterium]|nr:hypothetical protein [Cryomorphaceae bacterium]
TLSELDPSFNATGRVFNTNILDNSGAFQFNGISLASSYATTRVNGYYFNEVCGMQSAAPITLEAIVDLSAGNNVNLNVLTHLEKPRVEYLLSNGSTFTDAKQQAQKEVLAIFGIDADSITIVNSEQLNIAGPTDGDAVLIAVSSILQGYRSESGYSEIMADIISDIRTDGVLNSGPLSDKLYAHARALDITAIRNHVSDRYANIGITATVPGFEKYVNQFVGQFNNQTSLIAEFPASGDYGVNLLDPNNISFSASGGHSFRVDCPGQCSQVKVVLSFVSGSGTSVGKWFMNVALVNNWTVQVYDNVIHQQVFTSSTPGKCDLELLFAEAGTYRIEYYEGNETTPSFTKTITLN